jgi:proteasome accessory factor B
MPRPFEARVNRTERLLDLIASLLNAGRPVAFEEIRAWFPDDYGEPGDESARRKFERDKADLLQLGIPLRYVEPVDDLGEEGPGGYVIDREQFYLPEMRLQPEENAVLYLAGLSLLDQPSFPYREALEMALRKMELRTSGPRPVAEAALLGGRVLIDHAAGDSGDVAERLRGLEDALARRKRVTFRYEARYSGIEAERVVEPYGLFCRQGHWALVGHSRERDAVRVFLVHRMRQVTVNAASPSTADFEVPSGFRVRDYADVPAWRYDLGEPVEVVLEVRDDFAWLAEAELRSEGVPGEGGWRRFTVEATNPEALLAWTLGLGAKARIVGPAELRSRMKAQLSAMLSRAEAS